MRQKYQIPRQRMPVGPQWEAGGTGAACDRRKNTMKDHLLLPLIFAMAATCIAGECVRKPDPEALARTLVDYYREKTAAYKTVTDVPTAKAARPRIVEMERKFLFEARKCYVTNQDKAPGASLAKAFREQGLREASAGMNREMSRLRKLPEAHAVITRITKETREALRRDLAAERNASEVDPTGNDYWTK